IGRNVDAHKVSCAVRAVHVTDNGVWRDHFDVARVFEHLEIELHAVVDSEAHVTLDARRGDDHADNEGDQAKEIFALHPIPGRQWIDSARPAAARYAGPPHADPSLVEVP